MKVFVKFFLGGGGHYKLIFWVKILKKCNLTPPTIEQERVPSYLLITLHSHVTTVILYVHYSMRREICLKFLEEKTSKIIYSDLHMYLTLVPCNAMLSRLFRGILVKRRQSLFSHSDRVEL